MIEKKLKTLNVLSIALPFAVIAGSVWALCLTGNLFPMFAGLLLLLGAVMLRCHVLRLKRMTEERSCPQCDSTNISIISDSDTATAIMSRVGNISTYDNVGKQYKCNHCGNKW